MRLGAASAHTEGSGAGAGRTIPGLPWRQPGLHLSFEEGARARYLTPKVHRALPDCGLSGRQGTRRSGHRPRTEARTAVPYVPWQDGARDLVESGRPARKTHSGIPRRPVRVDWVACGSKPSPGQRLPPFDSSQRTSSAGPPSRLEGRRYAPPVQYSTNVRRQFFLGGREGKARDLRVQVPVRSTVRRLGKR
jgi:hypothetical protein